MASSVRKKMATYANFRLLDAYINAQTKQAKNPRETVDCKQTTKTNQIQFPCYMSVVCETVIEIASKFANRHVNKSSEILRLFYKFTDTSHCQMVALNQLVCVFFLSLNFKSSSLSQTNRTCQGQEQILTWPIWCACIHLGCC